MRISLSLLNLIDSDRCNLDFSITWKDPLNELFEGITCTCYFHIDQSCVVQIVLNWLKVGYRPV